MEAEDLGECDLNILGLSIIYVCISNEIFWIRFWREHSTCILSKKENKRRRKRNDPWLEMVYLLSFVFVKVIRMEENTLDRKKATSWAMQKRLKMYNDNSLLGEVFEGANESLSCAFSGLMLIINILQQTNYVMFISNAKLCGTRIWLMPEHMICIRLLSTKLSQETIDGLDVT